MILSPSPRKSEPLPEGPPPAMELMDMIAGKWVAQAISVAARLGIADLLADGPRTCEDLARECRVDAGSLFRLLRALASLGVFEELAPRQFGLTPRGMPLRSGIPGSVRGLASYNGQELFWRPWGELLWSVETGHPAFPRVYGRPMFEHFAEKPGDGAAFDQGMTDWSNQTTGAIVRAYDFTRFGLVADVGGGRGAMMAAILEACPETRGIVFDLPHLVGGARATIEARDLSTRCRAIGGDFFKDALPGADAYVLRAIVHNWDDGPAATILRNCRRGLAPGGRLLLLENVIGAANEPSLGKWVDLELLVMSGGRERTGAEYAALLAMAGFRLTRVVPTASPMSVIEAEPA